MKLSSLLSLLVLQPLAALACRGYLHCHCTSNDGGFDDAATTKVCGKFSSADANMIPANQWSDGAKECHYQGKERKMKKFWHYYGFSNCMWRELCLANGATGADSSCRDKPPLGKHSSKVHNIYVKPVQG